MILFFCLTSLDIFIELHVLNGICKFIFKEYPFMKRMVYLITIVLLSAGISLAQEAATEPVEQPSENKQDVLDLLRKSLSANSHVVVEDKAGQAAPKSFELHFALELEYEDVENEVDSPAGRTQEPQGYMEVDKFVLEPILRFDEKTTLRSELQFEFDKTFLRRSYVTFDDLFLNSALSIGLNCRFIRPSRKTETYPIIGTAYWRDDGFAFTLNGEKAPVYWYFSIGNGFNLNASKINEDNSFFIIHDDRNGGPRNDTRETGLGLGVEKELGKSGKVNALAFYYDDKLTKNEVLFMQGVSGYGVSEEDKRTRSGFSIDYANGPFDFFTQYIMSVDGKLDRSGYFVQASYDFDFSKMESFKFLPDKATVLIRYNSYDVDMDKDPVDSLTWDRQALTVAGLIPLDEFMTLKVEYNFNDESTGDLPIDNDEVLLQINIYY